MKELFVPNFFRFTTTNVDLAFAPTIQTTPGLDALFLQIEAKITVGGDFIAAVAFYGAVEDKTSSYVLLNGSQAVTGELITPLYPATGFDNGGSVLSWGLLPTTTRYIVRFSNVPKFFRVIYVYVQGGGAPVVSGALYGWRRATVP